MSSSRGLAVFCFSRLESQPGGMTRAWLWKVRVFATAGWNVKVVFVSKLADEHPAGWREAFHELAGGPIPGVEERWLWEGLTAADLPEATGGGARLAHWMRGWASGPASPVIFVDSPTVLPMGVRSKNAYNRTGPGLLGKGRRLFGRLRVTGPVRFPARLVFTVHLNHLAYRADPVSGHLTSRFAEASPLIRENVDALVVHTGRQAVDLVARFPELIGRVAVIGQACRELVGDVPPRADVPLCVAVTRLDANKRLDKLIELWPQVVARVPAAQLEIWGSGPEQERLRNLAAAGPATDSITLPGFAQQGMAVMARAWCTVMTSKRESFPLAVLESLSAGTPVVAFDVPYGPADAIRTGVDGYLIRDRDNAAFVRALAGVLASPALVSQLAEAARGPGGVRERFASDVVGRAWLDLAGELARPARPLAAALRCAEHVARDPLLTQRPARPPPTVVGKRPPAAHGNTEGDRR